jgi:hypothetical protein
VALLLFLATLSLRANEKPNYEKELTALIEDFLSSVRYSRDYKKRKKEAFENIPLVIKYCEQYRIDPLLQGINFAFEASWKNHAKGKDGEKGIGQTMPGKFYRGIDLKTIEGQIEGSTKRLRYALDQCDGNLRKALTHYVCGHCVSKSERTQRKIKLRHLLYEDAVNYYRRGIKNTSKPFDKLL